MTILFQVNKTTKEVRNASGQQPEYFSNITGMADLPYSEISDLTWAGYPDEGFLIEADVLALEGVDPLRVAELKAEVFDVQWDIVRALREVKINAVRWRTDRHNDEIALGMTPSEDITPVLTYIQELRDITEYFADDPFSVQWPVVPA